MSFVIDSFCGFILGSLNWFILYKLYRFVFLAVEDKFGGKKKLLLVVLILMKIFVVFGSFYIVIVVFNIDVLHLLLGLILSLIGMIIVLMRQNRILTKLNSME